MALILLFVTTALAAEKAPEGVEAPEGPVDIRSDKLTVHQKKHQAIFTGKVRAIQGDLTITCQTLTVTYAAQKDPQGKAGEITRMVFSGDVSIEQKERRGHCQRAEYHRTERRILCTGDPWVVEGDNRIRGDLIEYLLSKDEVRVTRPRALIRLEEGPKKEGGSGK
jgi:lipopolysaccharide export system protein LptA